MYSVFLYFLCIASPIFVQVYRPLPPGGNPVAVNKYRIVSYHNKFTQLLCPATENIPIYCVRQIRRFPCLKMEAGQISETSYFIEKLDNGQSQKEKIVSLNDIYTCMSAAAITGFTLLDT